MQHVHFQGRSLPVPIHHFFEGVIALHCIQNHGCLAMMVVRQLPDLVEALKCRLAMSPLNELRRQGCNRLQDAVGQNGAGNEAAHAELASGNHQCTRCHQHHIGNLLQRLQMVLGRFTDSSQAQFFAARGVRNVLPQTELAPTPLARL